MPRSAAAPVPVSDNDRRMLVAMVRRHSTPRASAPHAHHVLLAAPDVGVRATADRRLLWRSTVQRSSALVEYRGSALGAGPVGRCTEPGHAAFQLAD
jgi:hypothetical protein